MSISDEWIKRMWLIDIHINMSEHCGWDCKEFACNAWDLGLIPGSGRSPGEGNGNPLQCSCLENSMYRGAWGSCGHKELDTTEQLIVSLFFADIFCNNCKWKVTFKIKFLMKKSCHRLCSVLKCWKCSIKNHSFIHQIFMERLLCVWHF